MNKIKKTFILFVSKSKEYFSLFVKYFFLFIENIRSDMIFQKASALSYSTMLSLVPISTLSFSIFSNLKFFQNVKTATRKLIFKNFLPTQADIITGYIDKFSKNLSSLNTLSIIGLLLSGVFLLITLENILNSIWKTPNRKGLFRPIINYWTVLTLGPLFLGGSVYISGRMNVLAKASQLSFLTEIFSILSVYTFNILFMFVIFYVMPNIKVRIRSALIGATISGVGYEIMRKYFTHTVSKLVYNKIYSSLAIIPIFMFWLYLVWIIVLLGAELSRFLDTRGSLSQETHPSNSPLTFGLSVYFFIIKEYLEGKSETNTSSLLTYFKQISPIQMKEILYYLKEHKLILESEERGWIPYREPYRQKLGDTLNDLLNFHSQASETLPSTLLIKKIKSLFKEEFPESIPKAIEKYFD